MVRAREWESLQGKVNYEKKLHMWGSEKEDCELNFKGESVRTASCREMANTYRNSKEKKMELLENPEIEFPLTTHKEALLPIDLLLCLSLSSEMHSPTPNSQKTLVQ